MQTLPALAEAGELMAFRHPGFWHPMDTLRDVRNLNGFWEQGVVPWRVWDTPHHDPAARTWPEVKPVPRDEATQHCSHGQAGLTWTSASARR
jgi:NDP-sugar pyrophosphorylase family protein